MTALDAGIQRLASLPLSLRLVRELHGHLMRGVRGEHATPGEFRRSQNWIGPPGSTPQNAPYVPPPVDEMQHARQFGLRVPLAGPVEQGDRVFGVHVGTATGRHVRFDSQNSPCRSHGGRLERKDV